MNIEALALKNQIMKLKADLTSPGPLRERFLAESNLLSLQQKSIQDPQCSENEPGTEANGAFLSDNNIGHPCHSILYTLHVWLDDLQIPPCEKGIGPAELEVCALLYKYHFESVSCPLLELLSNCKSIALTAGIDV
jgi:hypothetical protein